MAGYTDLALRRKHNSLEYDIEGRSKLHSVALLGEAKAHESTINGKEVAAFVGKLLPRGAAGRVDGLFVSTSPFTPDAEDYLGGVSDLLQGPALQVEFRTLVGDEIPAFFSAHAAYVTEGVLRRRVESAHNMEMLDSWLVATDRNDFIVCSCGPNRVTAATGFVMFSADGSLFELEDETILDRLSMQIPDLAGLEPLSEGTSTLFTDRTQRLPTPVSGAGWFDYRFPAPPDCFIGRNAALAEVATAIESIRNAETAMRALQVLSRSGVGKSSLLIKLPEVIDRAVVVTVDGRNLRSPSDTRLMVSQSVEESSRLLDATAEVPRSLDEVNASLAQLGAALRERSAVLVIQVDQFESTLTLPPVFEAVLDLLETCTSQSLPIVWIFARKNDLAATYDEGAAVDLRRLNEISLPIALMDFSRAEGRELLDRLQDELGQTLRPDLAQAISAFSAGFPWLHKRLCAHVLTMQREGVTQRDLVQAGLRAEDLFEEDLAGLDEQDKSLLRRIAAHLPATANDLTRHLEAEVTAERLMERLNDFLGRKLLRRTGDIYDTYNDVFKTYLVTDSIPFESRFILRSSPRATLALLDVIGDSGPFELTAFQRRVGGNPINVLNKLRDLRLLGLIDPKPGRVALTPETRSALGQGTLGELLRKRLRANAVVLRVLDLIAAEEQAEVADVVRVLKRELPHVDVAEGQWTYYGKRVLSWMHFASMAQVQGSTVTRREVPADESLQGQISGGTFAPETFLPSVRPPRVVRLLELLGAGTADHERLREEFGDRIAFGVIRDAEALDLAVPAADGGLRLGRVGRMLVESGRPISVRDIAQAAIHKPNVKALLDAASDGPVNAAEQRRILTAFGSASWAPATWKQKLAVLRSWVMATGQVEAIRGEGIVIRPTAATDTRGPDTAAT